MGGEVINVLFSFRFMENLNYIFNPNFESRL